MKNIFITRTIPDIGISMLKDKGYNVDIWQKDRMMTKKELLKALKQKPYDALLCLLTDTIDKEIFDTCPTLKIVTNYAIGFNNIDVAEAGKRGIVATNTSMSSDCVAEHALALMLALTTRIVEGDRFMRKGKYKGWSPSLLVGTDMKRKTLGLVGTGKIGERVAYHANKGFDMNIVYHDMVVNERIEKDCGAKHAASLEELLKVSDIVSLHVPLLPSTQHLMNAEKLALMKKTAFLINTSRGPVVDENALVTALQNKTIAGAGLDVYEFEPKLAKGLSKLENVILTPHIASARESARNEMAIGAAENIISFFETGKAKTPVPAPKEALK